MESPAENNFSAVQNLKRQNEMSPNTRRILLDSREKTTRYHLDRAGGIVNPYDSYRIRTPALTVFVDEDTDASSSLK